MFSIVKKRKGIERGGSGGDQWRCMVTIQCVLCVEEIGCIEYCGERKGKKGKEKILAIINCDEC